MGRTHFTNRKKRKHSKYIGVYRSNKSLKYYAKKNTPFGEFTSKQFDKEIDAAHCYDKITKMLNKKNNKLNFPEKGKHINQNDDVQNIPKKKRKRRQYVIHKNTLTNTDKWNAQMRQNFHCNLCNKSFAKIGIPPDADHIVPLQYGGTNNYSNIQSLCKNCHSWKTQHFDKVINNMMEYKEYDVSVILDKQKELYLKSHDIMESIDHNIMLSNFLNNSNNAQLNVGCVIRK